MKSLQAILADECRYVHVSLFKFASSRIRHAADIDVGVGGQLGDEKATQCAVKRIRAVDAVMLRVRHDDWTHPLRRMMDYCCLLYEVKWTVDN